MDLKDQRALITGGSRGLGFALARELVSRGVRVALLARNETQLHQAVDRLRRHGQAHGIVGDVGDPHQIPAIAGPAGALLGRIDLLIHNASTLGPTPLRGLLDTDCEDFEQVLQTNLLGPFRLTKALAGPMLVRGHGTVLHISSDAAVDHYPNWGAYGASKAALDHLNGTFAAEVADLGGQGLRFLAIDPGEMDTAMHAAALPDADRQELAQPRAVARRIVERLARPEATPNGTRLTAAQLGGTP